MIAQRVKTILFVSLIVAMMLPFSMMDVSIAYANEANEKEKYKVNAKQYWLELHKDKIFKDKTETEKILYYKNLEKYIEQRTTQQIEFDIEAEILSKIVLDAKQNGDTIEQIIESKPFVDKLNDIKQLPVVKLSEKIDEFAANPTDEQQHPMMPELYGHQNTLHTSGESSASSTFPIGHVGSGVELGHGSYLKYPGLSIGHIIIHITIWDTTSHVTGTDWRTVAIAGSLYTGVWNFMSETCLIKKGTASSVSYTQISSNIVTSSLDTVLHSDYRSKDRTQSTEGLCYKILEDTSNNIPGGSSGSQSSGLTNIIILSST